MNGPDAGSSAPRMQKYTLYLFVAGQSYRSTEAIRSVRRLHDVHLKDRCVLKIVDIYQRPELAKSEQIIAVPTLVKKTPVPLKRFIGDLTDTEKILTNLD